MLETLRQQCSLLESRFAEPLDQRDQLTAGLLMVGGGLLYSLATPDGLASADGAVYLQQIRETDLWSRPTHVGYFALGWLWTQLLGHGDRVLNMLSAAFAGLALATTWLFSLRLADDRTPAACATAALAVNGLFVFNALHAEVYMVESSLLLLSLYFWLRQRAVWSGLLLAAAALVTPSALFMAPAYVVLRPRWKPLLWIGAATATALLVVVGPMAVHYLYGSRGLLSGASAGVNPLLGLRKEGMEIVLGAFCTWAFLAVGALAAARAPWARPLVAALGLGWAFNFVLGERFGDVPVQLPLYFWAAPLIAVALRELSEWEGRERFLGGSLVLVGAVAAPAVVLWALPMVEAVRDVNPLHLLLVAIGLIAAGVVGMFLVDSTGWWRPLFAAALLGTLSLTMVQARTVSAEVTAYRQAVLSDLPAEPLAIGGWSPGILFEHYRYGRSYTDHWLDERELRADPAGGKQRVLRELSLGREIWLLDNGALEVLGPDFEGLANLVRGERGPIETLASPTGASYGVVASRD